MNCGAGMQAFSLLKKMINGLLRQTILFCILVHYGDLSFAVPGMSSGGHIDKHDIGKYNA